MQLVVCVCARSFSLSVQCSFHVRSCHGVAAGFEHVVNDASGMLSEMQQRLQLFGMLSEMQQRLQLFVSIAVPLEFREALSPVCVRGSLAKRCPLERSCIRRCLSLHYCAALYFVLFRHLLHQQPQQQQLHHLALYLVVASVVPPEVSSETSKSRFTSR